MIKITTADLSKFGAKEREEATNIMTAWSNNGLPEGFYNDKVKIMFNQMSGFVFLTNSDFQVAMLADGKLEMYYTCFECGKEGFKEDMTEDCCQKSF